MNKSVLAGLLAISSIVSAQADENTIDSNQSNNLQEVVVTASLAPVQLQQTGNAVYVISSDDIERSHASVVSDLLRDVPGVACTFLPPLNCTVTVAAALAWLVGSFD